MSGDGVRVHRGAFASAVMIGGLGVLAGWQAWGYALWRGKAPGEGLYPFAVAVALVLLAAWFAREALVSPEADPAGADPEDGPPAYGKVAVYLAGLAAFGLLLEPVGWVSVTAVVLLVILRVAEDIAWSPAIGVVASTVALTHLIFERLLALPLPHGVLY